MCSSSSNTAQIFACRDTLFWFQLHKSVKSHFCCSLVDVNTQSTFRRLLDCKEMWVFVFRVMSNDQWFSFLQMLFTLFMIVRTKIIGITHYSLLLVTHYSEYKHPRNVTKVVLKHSNCPAKRTTIEQLRYE